MKNSSFTLPFAIIASSLIFGLTTGLSAKETGFYLHGGITYWDGFDASSLDDEIPLPGLSIDHELNDSRAKLSLGVGFHLDDQWSFEGFYVSTPEQEFSGTNWMFPPFQPGGDPISVTWSATTNQTIGGISAIYDHHINDNLSLFGKGGIAFVRHESSHTISAENLPDIVLENIIPPTFSDKEDTQEIFGAIGARIPIMQGRAGLTLAYQFIQTDDDPETSFEIGFQWNL